ncbi:MAG: hypothetical protein ACHBN1_18805 [Heteroscytonema crispum UTEX LB 1556]
MKNYSKYLVYLISYLGLFTSNFAFYVPAQASIVCELDSINKYQNGSLSRCILGQNMNLQISSSKFGISNFPCQAKNYIFFDEKGQFQSCELSESINIRRGNSVETCPAEYMIHVSIPEDGNLSITCQKLR